MQPVDVVKFQQTERDHYRQKYFREESNGLQDSLVKN